MLVGDSDYFGFFIRDNYLNKWEIQGNFEEASFCFVFFLVGRDEKSKLIPLFLIIINVNLIGK